MDPVCILVKPNANLFSEFRFCMMNKESVSGKLFEGHLGVGIRICIFTAFVTL